jgi:hypothetical protein
MIATLNVPHTSVGNPVNSASHNLEKSHDMAGISDRP